MAFEGAEGRLIAGEGSGETHRRKPGPNGSAEVARARGEERRCRQSAGGSGGVWLEWSACMHLGMWLKMLAEAE